MGTGIQQQDVVIDGVFGAVLLQPLAQQRGCIGVALDCRSLHKSHQRSIGGDEADIGRALEKVAHQNIDGHLGAGRQVAHAVAQVGGGNVLHHLLGQRGERGTRLVQGMQETRRLARAHDACSGVDDLPAKIQALQRSFELLQRPHLRRHDVIRQWKTHQPPQTYGVRQWAWRGQRSGISLNDSAGDAHRKNAPGLARRKPAGQTGGWGNP